MQTIKNPTPDKWPILCQRPVIAQKDMDETVAEILATVKTNGDEAVRNYTRQFDKVTLSQLAISLDEIKVADNQVPPALKEAIQLAKKNIEAFHKAQVSSPQPVETAPGVVCWQQSVGIEKVGLYIPGGSAPLFSTILMLGIPARLAGCKEIVLCTPPDKNGTIDPAILYSAGLVGITEIFKVGGAQAIAAMAYGTETVPRTDKIFGPGNQFVTRAKEMVQLGGVAIDMPAGPSEVLIIADETGNPNFIAADLLAQAEHGPDSQVVLLSTSMTVLTEAIAAVNNQLSRLPRQDTTARALQHSRFIFFYTMEACLVFSNTYAPEHLIIASDKAADYTGSIINAGSVFLGNYSCESAGDYASGTNHSLPTNGFARSYSGVSVDSFVRKITFQKLSRQGLQNIGPAIEQMATAEGLFAHRNAVSIRLKTDNND